MKNRNEIYNNETIKNEMTIPLYEMTITFPQFSVVN